MWKNITRLICMVCAITLTFSCSHSEKSKYLSMCSRAINISTEHMLKINPNRRIYQDWCDDEKSYHFIIYFDSLRCATCEINKLNEWHKLLLDIYSDYYDIKCIIIFSPQKQKIQSVVQSIYNSSFGHTIYIDTLGIFARSNPNIPADIRFHTFLLDEKENVIFIGNPCSNKKLQDTFFQVIRSHKKKKV